MRITGGKARGIPLKAPRGEGTRPATDRLREAVFSSLGPDVKNTRVADLFAGTGAYGLEALSRGAASVTFYETDRHALRCLQWNIQAVSRSCGAGPATDAVRARDVFQMASGSAACDLIFIDPPYDRLAEDLDRIFTQAVAPLSHRATRVVLELPGNLDPQPEGWTMVKRLGKVGRDKPTAAIYARAAAE